MLLPQGNGEKVTALRGGALTAPLRAIIGKRWSNNRISLGSFVFGGLMDLGFSRALLFFCAAQLLAALAAIPLYRSEKSPNIKAQQPAVAGILL